MQINVSLLPLYCYFGCFNLVLYYWQTKMVYIYGVRHAILKYVSTVTWLNLATELVFPQMYGLHIIQSTAL